MSISKNFLDYVLDMLSPLGEVTSTKMFSGVLLKVNDKQLGALLNNALYFKVVDSTLQTWYRENGSKQFSYTRKDKSKPIVIKNWWSVPESAMDNEEELVCLARIVLKQKN